MTPPKLAVIMPRSKLAHIGRPFPSAMVMPRLMKSPRPTASKMMIGLLSFLSKRWKKKTISVAAMQAIR